MTGVEIAGILKDYGPWGLCALLMLALRYVFGLLQSCQEARIADAKLGTEAISRQASTNAEIATITAALREGQTEIMRIVSLMQRDAENDDERLQEKIVGLVRAIEEMGRRVETTCRGVAR